VVGWTVDGRSSGRGVLVDITKVDGVDNGCYGYGLWRCRFRVWKMTVKWKEVSSDNVADGNQSSSAVVSMGLGQ